MTAPTPPDVVVETLARALFEFAEREDWPEDQRRTWDETWPNAQGYYRRLAAAGIAALPPSPGSADRAALLTAAQGWILRHSSQPDGDRWRDNPDHLAWSAENLLCDLRPWITAASPSPAEEAVRWATAEEVASRYFDRGDDEWEQLRTDVAEAMAGNLRADPSPAEEAVKRVEALADELEREAGERQRRAEWTPGSASFAADRIRLFAGARHQRLAASRIRAALASPAPAPQGEEREPCMCCGCVTDRCQCDCCCAWTGSR